MIAADVSARSRLRAAIPVLSRWILKWSLPSWTTARVRSDVDSANRGPWRCASPTRASDVGMVGRPLHLGSGARWDRAAANRLRAQPYPSRAPARPFAGHG
ncbi:hypothetical protein Pa4123_89840 [Phytohabitans aurantiacus]|uniref:Uncharacterized protein n=1 Tax=Phytohabitans aurantiacus TaxID=3016789 RepID=A0ABQ5RAL3_9ACTN|nr:hypothetical protein Pa4123_89840 [Phytohabitans aurantiacus]